MLFSLVTAFSLSEFNFRKEKGERELYANQLANERDVITEVEYTVALVRKHVRCNIFAWY